MSRTKKSRKPGSAPTAKPKLSKAELANVEKRVRKKTGKKPGNRQQEARQVSGDKQNTNQKKDPRIGSKKPIDLGVASSSTKTQTSTTKQKKSTKTGVDPIAAIRRVDSSGGALSLAQQLANIEADERLQIILEKQEEELPLTQDEVNYFNDMMERHQQISDQLGDDEDNDAGEELQTNQRNKFSEDDLWDKLDSSSVLDSFKESDAD